MDWGLPSLLLSIDPSRHNVCVDNLHRCLEGPSLLAWFEADQYSNCSRRSSNAAYKADVSYALFPGQSPVSLVSNS